MNDSVKVNYSYKINKVLRYIFFAIIVKPLMYIIIGLNIRNSHLRLNSGPAIIVANHNSHLDTLALMSIFPLTTIKNIHPVAASDYFLSNKLLAWFSQSIIGIIPLNRNLTTFNDPFADIVEALRQNKIIILFPEGSRGIPEKLDKFKTGIAHLAKRCPEVPIVPVFLHGFGKALPKGEALLVPFFCDIFLGEKIFWTGNKSSFMDKLEGSMLNLARAGNFTAWE